MMRWRLTPARREALADLMARVGLIAFAVFLLWAMFPRGIALGAVTLRATATQGIAALVAALFCLGRGWWSLGDEG